MSPSPRTLRRDPRVFISAVTSELRTVRELSKKALLDSGCHPIEQDNFPPDYRDMVDLHRHLIEPCDAVIHIAGHCSGKEPANRPASEPRRSFTQLEYDIAMELGKPVYVFLTDKNFPADPHGPESPELQALQEAHRQRLIASGRDYTWTGSREHLDQKIRSIQFVQERLKEELEQAAQKIEQIEHDFAERFLHQLLIDKQLSAEEARQRALKELPALVKLPLAEIESLIDRKIAPRVAEPSLSPLERARAALTKGDYDGVFQVVDPHRQEGRELAMLEGTAALAKFRESPRSEWNERALAAFQRALALSDPTSATEWEAWTKAAVAAAYVLDDLARYSESEPLLRESLRLREAHGGPDSPELAVVLNNLALLLRDTNRLGEAEPLYRRALAIDEQSYGPDHPNVATCLNNLAGLLRATNRLGEAEPLYRRALAIDEHSYGPDHPSVAIDLNNLALLLTDTNRPGEAEPLYRRALAIDEHSYGPDHPSVAIRLNNLAELLQDTNRPGEAEPLYRRALAIDEHSYGPDHPSVATDLNNLAKLLYSTNRLGEAEPLYRRALAIDEHSYGPDHPSVAIRLNNLAALLYATNRLAEPLFRRALAIDERSYGSEHPLVANDLNNLAHLLGATNRLAEAEPLVRRALAINERSYGPENPLVAMCLHKLARLLKDTNRLAEVEPLMARVARVYSRFRRTTGHEHSTQGGAIENYRWLLSALKLSEPEIEARMKAATEGTEKLEPIVPEVERLLGPAKSTKEVLDALDRRYRAEGKPAVWFLSLDQPIAPHLDELLGKESK
jgi:tetratricopeptide (TPR) repeat protein